VIHIFKTGVFILRAPVFIWKAEEFQMMNLVYQPAKYRLLSDSVTFKTDHLKFKTEGGEMVPDHLKFITGCGEMLPDHLKFKTEGGEMLPDHWMLD